MRCFLIFKLLILFVIQVSSQKDFIVKTDLLGIPIAIINKDFYAGLSFEKGLKKNYSMNFGLSYGLVQQNRSNDLVKNETFVARCYVKKYFSKTSFLKKWYCGVYLQNSFRTNTIELFDNNISMEEKFDIRKYNYTGLGGLLGYQLLTKRGFCLDVCLGFGAAYLSYYQQKTIVLGINPKKIIPGSLGLITIGYNFSNLFKNEKVPNKE
ncbi:MAG: DUF3575 domain-containing protein [Bacteroidia bacterium]